MFQFDSGIVLTAEQRGAHNSSFWRLFVEVPSALVPLARRGLLAVHDCQLEPAALETQFRRLARADDELFAFAHNDTASAYARDLPPTDAQPHFQSMWEEARLRTLCAQLHDEELFWQCLLDTSGANGDRALELELIHSALGHQSQAQQLPLTTRFLTKQPLVVVFRRAEASRALRVRVVSAANTVQLDVQPETTVSGTMQGGSPQTINGTLTEAVYTLHLNPSKNEQPKNELPVSQYSQIWMAKLACCR